MKKLGIIIISLVLTGSAQAQVSLPFFDGFNYGAGATLAGNAPWVAGSGTTQIKVGSTNLTYAGLQASTGLDVTEIPTSSSARTYVNFASQTSGTVYFSFLVKINTVPNAQRLIAYVFNSSSSSSSPYIGFFVNGTPQLLIGHSTSTPQFSTNITAGSTCFVVVGYTFGASSDTADIWINPTSLGGAAPAATASITSTHHASLTHFLWNTVGTSSGAGTYEVDELRIGNTYSNVTPVATIPPPPPPPSDPVITETFLAPDGSVVLRGVGGAPTGTYEVITAADVATPLANWVSIATNVFDSLGHFDCTNPVSSFDTEGFYRVKVAGTNTPVIAPSITNQPQDQIVLEGQSAVFSVGASGNPLYYQWYFNTNSPVADETNATLILSNVQSNDVGGYSVIVSNSAGSVTSVVASLTLGEPITNGDFYVSNTGNDSNPGTYQQPFYNLQHAIDLAQPGNTIYVRGSGGTFMYTPTITINHAGTSNNLIKIFAYPGEKPVFDFVNQSLNGSNRGIILTTSGNYWHIKGLEILRAGDNGIKVEGSHNLFELLVLHHNRDTGLQIGFAHETNNPGDLGAYNTVINCDSYMNFDPPDGQDADAFACKLHPGFGNVFMGCRGWRNCDDGWDLFESDHTVIISNCWTWHNGDASLYSAIGNGNGFKLGGNGSGGSSAGTHYLLNCIAFNNNFPGRTAHGIDQNSHHGGLIIYNCLSFNNMHNYYLEDSAGANPQIVRNDVSFSGLVSVFGAGTIEDHNTWKPGPDETDHAQVNPDVGSFSPTDFNNLTEAAAEAPRQPDGSLPTGFAHLINGSSNLINKGIDVGLPFTGPAPDLGAYEFGGP